MLLFSLPNRENGNKKAALVENRPLKSKPIKICKITSVLENVDDADSLSSSK